MTDRPDPQDRTDDSEHAAPLAVGERLWTGYRVVRHLNRSLDSDVYVVDSSSRGCACIAKCVLPWKQDQERSPARLRREGELLRRLAHPNIVRGFSVKAEPVGMVLELLDGQTLHARTRALGDLSWRGLATLGVDLTAALQYLHGAGYLHLDLKPENVMVTTRGAVLIDLNLARRPGPGRRGVGSRYYMAPEQVEGAELGPATDVFAFGMVMYVAASCSLPASGEEHHPHLHNPIRPISERRNLPPLLASTIDSCLQIDPAQRPSLQKLRRDLARMLARLADLESRLL
jgi:serine/threonine protein kinase